MMGSRVLRSFSLYYSSGKPRALSNSSSGVLTKASTAIVMLSQQPIWALNSQLVHPDLCTEAQSPIEWGSEFGN